MSVTPSAPPDASGTVRGLVNLVAQTFAGAKTFVALLTASAGIQLNAQLLSGTAYTFGAGGFFGANPAWVTTNTTKFIIQNGTPISGFAGIDVRATGAVQFASALGAGASDVVVKVGSSQADGSVNASAKLLSIRTGISGTEIERAFFQKGGLTFWGASSSAIKWDNGTPGVSWQIEAAPGTGSLRFGNNTSTYFGLRFSDGYAVSEFGYEFSVGATVYLKTRLGALDQWGTDSTGTPGAATINKPTGKSAIAIGASSVVITNSLVTAASRVIITQHARDATCKELIAVPAAGSFTVSGTANATAALPFSWQVSNIL